MRKLTVRKETLAELSTDELAAVAAGAPQQPTPPYYFTLGLALCTRIRDTTGPEPTPPYTNTCPN